MQFDMKEKVMKHSEMKHEGFTVSEVVIVCMFGGFIGILVLPGLVFSKTLAAEKNVGAKLEMIRNAEDSFRANGGLGAFYYTADVAGLANGKLPEKATPVQYISAEGLPKSDIMPAKKGTRFDWNKDGKADWEICLDSPEKPVAFDGYYFGSLCLDEEGNPYKAVGNGANEKKFGFFAVPSEYGVTGRYQFQINETGALIKKDSGSGRPIIQFEYGQNWTPAN